MCRQLLSEIAPGAEVLVGDHRTMTVEELLPGGFGPADLDARL
jgi:cytidine deaminase